MSTRWIGLLLFVLWVGGSGIAHAAPQITVSPDSPPDVDFGSVRSNNGAANPTSTQTFQISSNGSPSLMITGITFSLGDYRLNPSVSFPLTIMDGTSQTITVEFNPSQTGTRSTTMTIANNSMTPSKVVNLTGEGTAAVISVPATTFGIVPNGTPSSQNVTITNTVTPSPGPLTVTSATITGSTFFHFDNTLGCTGGTTCTFSPPLVIPGGTSTVPIICQPPATASGTSSGTLTFTSDSDSGGDRTGTLTCTAGRADIAVASSLNFTNVAVGQSQPQTVTITNNGNIPLTYGLTEVPDVTQFAITAGCTSSCSISPTPPNNTATFTLTFTPDSPAQVSTSISISNNDPDSGDNPKSIAITGTGDQGVIATDPPNPTALDFGGVAQGSTRTLSFTLKNTGNVTITGIAATLNNPNLGFQFTPASVPTSLTANQQTSINVTFAPAVGTTNVATSITFTGSWTADGQGAQPTTTALQLSGQGLTTGYDVSPGMRAFGDFRFDTRPTLTYSITNTAQADLTVLAPADFVPDAPTINTEFAFAGTKNGAPISLTPPITLRANEHLDVTVTAQPNNRIGTLSGHVNIRTNLMPDRQVMLSANAITAGISVPATVDFGPVDVDGTPPSQTIKLTNNGAATLDIDSIAKMAGGSSAFTVTPLPTTKTTVAPGADFSLTVTYAPTMARAMNQPELLVLDAALAGIVPGPSHALITLQGYGIDRILNVVALDSFPDTFRNPGDSAPIQAIKVSNDGLAPLRVTAVMISDDPPTAGEPVWQLIDSTPAEIKNGAPHDFMVRFAPKQLDDATHSTPRGHLLLINDDNAKPMATVDLVGKCIDRNVGFGPGGAAKLDLGQIGVGIPTVVDLPPVYNLDRVGFTIRSIELNGSQAFQLDADPRNVELPVGAMERFTMTLEPTAPGTVTTTVRLFLDQDPDPHRELTMTATAVFVEAHGSGGCSAGGARSGGGAAFALGALTALGALGGRRRRRARTGATSAARPTSGGDSMVTARSTAARSTLSVTR
ncbi:MAG TPA: choice-of-anchor D domain-containing protein [Kofleriaceae bacterium]|nr:choice-of-anchor D domain-containing protein [Kofleriaceae bacterium]